MMPHIGGPLNARALRRSARNRRPKAGGRRTIASLPPLLRSGGGARASLVRPVTSFGAYPRSWRLEDLG